MTFTIQWKGIENVRANLRTIADKYPDLLGLALKDVGDKIIRNATVICPYDQDNPHDDGTPHLNETGKTEGPETGNGEVKVTLSFGDGIESIYPILQHEVQEYHHDQPEQWKYLQHPMDDEVHTIASDLIRYATLEKAMSK